MPLYSFGAGMSVVVVGASGGIGRALTSILSASPAVARITACSRSGAVPEHPKVRHQRLDLEDEATIAGAAEAVQADGGVLDLVFVASGILHADEALRPEKTWRALDGAALERVYRINAVGAALVAKHFLPLLARDRKSVFAALSARVGSISDNHLGGWHAYRASKAALNMLLRTFAIELARRNLRAVCVGLHPGTVDTGLSAPFQTNVPEASFSHLTSPPRVCSKSSTASSPTTAAKCSHGMARRFRHKRRHLGLSPRAGSVSLLCGRNRNGDFVAPQKGDSPGRIVEERRRHACSAPARTVERSKKRSFAGRHLVLIP
jgi:NAD(P)-dependent dehydrogenase (short-subunit alcohol dehydrogenase family)